MFTSKTIYGKDPEDDEPSLLIPSDPKALEEWKMKYYKKQTQYYEQQMKNSKRTSIITMIFFTLAIISVALSILSSIIRIAQ